MMINNFPINTIVENNYSSKYEKPGFTVRDVFVPSNPFSPAQIYSIRLADVCEKNNISREGHRALISLMNEILADPSLGNKKKKRIPLH